MTRSNIFYDYQYKERFVAVFKVSCRKEIRKIIKSIKKFKEGTGFSIILNPNKACIIRDSIIVITNDEYNLVQLRFWGNIVIIIKEIPAPREVQNALILYTHKILQ